MSYNTVWINETSASPNYNGVFDYVQVLNTTATQSQIDAHNKITYIPEWTGDTNFLNNFNNNINMNNVPSNLGEIEYFSVYKYSETDKILTHVGDFLLEQDGLLDYSIRNRTTYQYVIFAVTSDYMSNAITLPPVTTRWDCWSIANIIDTKTDGVYSIDTNSIWAFNTNLTSGGYTQNIDTYTYDNFTQFPKISKGEKNYYTGTLTAYLNNIQSMPYYDTVEMQDKFCEFINSPNLKLLKDRKGNCLIVQTTGNSFAVQDNAREQMITVSFNFTQVVDTSKFGSIIG